MTDSAAAGLRHTDRKRLAGYLARLGHADPCQRAQAALDATGLLHRRGLDWSALVPVEPAERGDDAPPLDWQRRALALSVHPGVVPDDQRFFATMAGWRAPGRAGMARLRMAAERVGTALPEQKRSGR